MERKENQRLISGVVPTVKKKKILVTRKKKYIYIGDRKGTTN